MTHITLKQNNNINKKMFNSTLCNGMKIGQIVDTAGYQCKFKVGTERVKQVLCGINDFSKHFLLVFPFWWLFHK